MQEIQATRVGTLGQKDPLEKEMKVKSESEVAQSCPSLSDPMDCSLTGSSVHAGKDQGQKEKGVAEDEMVEWHHRLNGHV